MKYSIELQHLPSGKLFYSKTEELDNNGYKEIENFLQQASGGELEYMKFKDSNNNVLIFGKKILEDCVIGMVID